MSAAPRPDPNREPRGIPSDVWEQLCLIADDETAIAWVTQAYQADDARMWESFDRMATRASYILGFEAVVASALFGLSNAALSTHLPMALASGAILVAALVSALLAIHGFSYSSVPDPATALRTAANPHAAKFARMESYARAKVYNERGMFRHRWYVTASSFLLILGTTTYVAFVLF